MTQADLTYALSYYAQALAFSVWFAVLLVFVRHAWRRWY